MSRKEENALLAKSWLKMIEKSKTYSQCVDAAIKSTGVRKDTLIGQDELSYALSKADSYERCITVTKQTTYDAMLDLYDDVNSVCVLNFASFFKPGGGFLKGAYTQEESLCHVSGLYPVLKDLDIYKERYDRDKVPEEYTSEVIYSRGVPFTSTPGSISSPMLVDVISCAAPNCTRVPISKMDRVERAIKERLTACYILPYLNGCEGLVLGAWGCGVFKNNPQFVASTFKMLNDTYGGLYKKVVYAVPTGSIREVFENIMFSE